MRQTGAILKAFNPFPQLDSSAGREVVRRQYIDIFALAFETCAYLGLKLNSSPRPFTAPM